MKKYKVQNKLECNLRIGNILFKSKEIKILDFKPISDRFIVEEIVEPIKEPIIKSKNSEVKEKNIEYDEELIIEKMDKKGETVSAVSKKKKLNRRKE